VESLTFWAETITVAGALARMPAQAQRAPTSRREVPHRKTTNGTPPWSGAVDYCEGSKQALKSVCWLTATLDLRMFWLTTASSVCARKRC
jgi:hypothetical protein